MKGSNSGQGVAWLEGLIKKHEEAARQLREALAIIRHGADAPAVVEPPSPVRRRRRRSTTATVATVAPTTGGLTPEMAIRQVLTARNGEPLRSAEILTAVSTLPTPLRSRTRNVRHVLQMTLSRMKRLGRAERTAEGWRLIDHAPASPTVIA